MIGQLGRGYGPVMARKEEILLGATGLDYASFETAGLGFDYDKMMASAGYDLASTIAVRTATSAPSSASFVSRYPLTHTTKGTERVSGGSAAGRSSGRSATQRMRTRSPSWADRGVIASYGHRAFAIAQVVYALARSYASFRLVNSASPCEKRMSIAPNMIVGMPFMFMYPASIV